ncbi:hypothetical protein F2P81_004540 [Scophthalmus maximus]|uniref:Uncharacterized protein n=1 Tax=Scophthalmus maximus TaxID=52904 RepID=A0A6A4TB37_SCOMX|nr:hypothetical protein F2P81_004540 [Scophthalmus maximus]
MTAGLLTHINFKWTNVCGFIQDAYLELVPTRSATSPYGSLIEIPTTFPTAHNCERMLRLSSPSPAMSAVQRRSLNLNLGLKSEDECMSASVTSKSTPERKTGKCKEPNLIISKSTSFYSLTFFIQERL